MTEAGKRLIAAARQARSNIARGVRYLCLGDEGPNGHCADLMLPQCDHCAWAEQQKNRGNYEDRIENNC